MDYERAELCINQEKKIREYWQVNRINTAYSKILFLQANIESYKRNHELQALYVREYL
jgi:hypothetical protein